jgi:hypothetical protein
MKTTIAKKIIVLVGLVMLITNLSAQRAVYDTNMTAAERRNLLNGIMKEFNYKYVFQGKVISTNYITVAKGEDIYENFPFYLIEVQRVLKGDIKKGTIEIMGPGGNHHKKGDGVEFISSEGFDYPPGEAIYFSNCDAEVGITDSSVVNTNLKTLIYYDGIPLSNGELVKGPRELTQCFSSLSEFYDYLRTNGFKIDGQ